MEALISRLSAGLVHPTSREAETRQSTLGCCVDVAAVGQRRPVTRIVSVMLLEKWGRLTSVRLPADAFVNSQEWTLSRSVPELKVGIVGNLASGKSALVHRYLTGTYVQEESPEGHPSANAVSTGPVGQRWLFCLPSQRYKALATAYQRSAGKSPRKKANGNCVFAAMDYSGLRQKQHNATLETAEAVRFYKVESTAGDL
ncbi:hypothetical protein SRHO_G00338490 [Serrasalmus rhombeus]